MSRLKFLTSFGLLMLFVLALTTSSESKNRPVLIDHDQEYSHPWGGDENNGGDNGFVATTVQPDSNDYYRYVNGTKSGIVFGALNFLFDGVELFLRSYSTGVYSGDKRSSGPGATSTSLGSSNTLSSGGFGGKGGK